MLNFGWQWNHHEFIKFFAGFVGYGQTLQIVSDGLKPCIQIYEFGKVMLVQLFGFHQHKYGLSLVQKEKLELVSLINWIQIWYLEILRALLVEFQQVHDW